MTSEDLSETHNPWLSELVKMSEPLGYDLEIPRDSALSEASFLLTSLLIAC